MKNKKQLIVIIAVCIIMAAIGLKSYKTSTNDAKIDVKEIIIDDIEEEKVYDKLEEKKRYKGLHVENYKGSKYIMISFGKVVGLDMEVYHEVKGDNAYFRVTPKKTDDHSSVYVFKVFKTDAKEIYYNKEDILNPYINTNDFKSFNTGYIKDVDDNYIYIVPIENDFENYRRYTYSEKIETVKGLVNFSYEKTQDDEFPRITEIKKIDRSIKEGRIIQVNKDKNTINIELGENNIKFEVHFDKDNKDLVEKIKESMDIKDKVILEIEFKNNMLELTNINTKTTTL